MKWDQVGQVRHGISTALYYNCFTSSSEHLKEIDFPSSQLPTVCGINLLTSQVYCTDFVHAKLDICYFSNYIKEIETWLHIR